MKKIDESIVDQIRDLYSFKDLPIKVIAEKLNISESTVYKVIDDNCMADHENLVCFAYAIKYLIRIGKIADKTRPDGKHYIFDLSNEELKTLEDVYMPQYQLAKDMEELTTYFKRLAE